MEFRVEGVLQLVNLQLGLNIAAQAQHEAQKAVHGWKVQGKKYQEVRDSCGDDQGRIMLTIVSGIERFREFVGKSRM